MYEDMTKQFEVEYIAGGATQNSIRVAQWILQVPSRYMGLVTRMKPAGWRRAGGRRQRQLHGGRYHADRHLRRARERRRALARRRAQRREQLQDRPPVEAEELEARQGRYFYYSADFFLTVSPDSMLKVAKHSAEEGKCHMTACPRRS